MATNKKRAMMRQAARDRQAYGISKIGMSGVLPSFGRLTLNSAKSRVDGIVTYTKRPETRTEMAYNRHFQKAFMAGGKWHYKLKRKKGTFSIGPRGISQSMKGCKIVDGKVRPK